MLKLFLTLRSYKNRQWAGFGARAVVCQPLSLVTGDKKSLCVKRLVGSFNRKVMQKA